MDGISPSLLHRAPSTAGSSTPEPQSDSNPRKRRRPNDPPHEAPAVPPPDATPEERRAARAQRNRIAAQFSRDRRKEEQKHLRDRIAELEKENETLRAGVRSPVAKIQEGASETWKKEMERENRELREKVASLERAWNALLPTLAASEAVKTVISPVLATISSPLKSSLQSPVEIYHQTAPTRHLAAGGQLEPSSLIPNLFQSALDRDSPDWLLGLLQPAAQPDVPPFSTVSTEEVAPADDGPLPESTSSTPQVRSTESLAEQEVTFLPTPAQTAYSGSELDLSEVGCLSATDTVLGMDDMGGADDLQRLLSELVNEGFYDTSAWGMWEGCGLEASESGAPSDASGVNVF